MSFPAGFPEPRHGLGQNIASNSYSAPAAPYQRSQGPTYPAGPYQNNMPAMSYTYAPGQQPAYGEQISPTNQQGTLTKRVHSNAEKYPDAYAHETGSNTQNLPASARGTGSSVLYQWRFFGNPHGVYRSGLVYADPSEHFHRDSLTRETSGIKRDCYMSPNDGKIKTLVVSATYDMIENAGDVTWKRTKVRNVVPWMYRVALWPFNHTALEVEHWSSDEWLWVTLKWIPACLCLSFAIAGVGDIEGEVRNGLNYEPFPYRYFGYSKAARNMLEHKPDALAQNSQHDISASRAVLQDIHEKVIGPRRLFVLAKPESSDMLGHSLVDFSEKQRQPDYVFIAWTAEQFKDNDDYALLAIAERAARDARVGAFWLSSHCMNADDPYEVYRISDIVRCSSALAVAVGPDPVNARIVTPEDMIKQFGQRVWTFPEILLSKASKPIRVYVRGNEVAPIILSKLRFAAQVFDDSKDVRSLIDHFEGTITLSRLELTTLAYECIQSRKTKSFVRGDYSYALMGLLNIRAVHPSDSAFQAFARLSLLNDSDRLLERLICMLPENGQSNWSATKDCYKARLWDIEPTIQVSGVGEDDTVIIDGARAASVRWKAFKTVASAKQASWKRLFSKFFLHTSGAVFWIGVVMVAIPGLGAIGAVLLVYGLIMVGLSPWLLRVMYGGKIWKTQAWLFAFEGYMPIEKIEKRIFGARMNRLDWSPYSSPMSRHKPNEHNECIGVDPMLYPETQKMLAASRTATHGQPRIFTLVDTASMTVTLFQAVSPPIAFLLVGSEGGMQRAVGVSYDWESQTMVKETVLRLETPTIDRMERVPRVKLSLGKKAHAARLRSNATPEFNG